MKKHIDKIMQALRGMGAEDLRLDTSRRHPRLEWTRHGNPFSMVVSGTPRDPDNAIRLAVREARQLMQIPVDTGPAPKRKRHKRTVKPRLQTPAPTAPAPRDPLEPLCRHPMAGPALQQRLDAAYKRLWMGTCLELFGAPSVTALMRRK